MKNSALSSKAFKLAKKIFSYNRSLTGKDNLKTLKNLQKINPKLKIFKIKSGTKVFDWEIPKEWNVKKAWIKDSQNKKIIDFKKNNLHLVSYSTSFKGTLNYNQLKKKIYYLKKQPDAIPYKTAFYDKQWGFCMSYNQFKNLNQKKKYNIEIDSSHKLGHLHYGEIKIKGKIDKEILISTYICHPSMANDNLSGVVFSIFLSKWISSLKNKKYSYRIVFVPESIGSIAYIHKNKQILKNKTIAGFNFSCIGDEGNFSVINTRDENTLTDHICEKIFKKNKINYKKYSWLYRGSDEKHYCYPGIDLPVVNISRSLFNKFKEYHTSLDTLGKTVTKKGLEKSFKIIKKIILDLEHRKIYHLNYECIPQLSKRSLYPKTGTTYKTLDKDTKLLVDFMAYCDGKTTDKQIAKKLKVKFSKVRNAIKILEKNKLII